MLFWILQISVFSILFILLVHHLFTYFTTTLTVPKVKDLVNKTSQKYEEMFSVLYDVKENEKGTIGEQEKMVSATSIDILPFETPSKDIMKNELKHFLKEKMQDTISSSPSLSYSDF